jgi:hypothetical protein
LAYTHREPFAEDMFNGTVSGFITFLTEVACLKNAVFWNVTPYGSSKNTLEGAFFIVTAVKTSNLT